MRAAIVFSLCLGVASVAYGQATYVDGGVPRDVVAWQPGVYSVATTTRAELRKDDVTSAQLSLLNGAGTFWGTAPTECFAGVNQSGTLVSDINCWGQSNIIPGDPSFSNVLRVRFTPSGAGYAMARGEQSEPWLLMARPGEAGLPPWDALAVNPVSPLSNVMAVMETDGGVPHALFLTRQNQVMSQLVWFEEGAQQAELQVSDAPLALDLVPTSGGHPLALYASAAGIFRARLQPSVNSAFTRATVESGSPVSIVSLDVNTGSGSELGEGFGLAVGTYEGQPELLVLSAVPADSAENAGTLWRVHGGIGPPPGDPPAGPVQVSCVGAAYCVIAMNRPGDEFNPNLIIYSNDAAPAISGGLAPLREGDTSVLSSFTAIDGDGDAVRMSLGAFTAPPFLDVTAEPGQDSLSVRLTAREVCQTEDAGTLRIQASDGLRAHDRREDVTIIVNNFRNPGQPGVTPTEVVTYGEPAVFTASPVDGGCPTVGYTWTGAPSLVTDGGTATFTPSLEDRCTPAGSRFTYEVRGLDPGGVASDAGTFTVNVAPWGRPSAPFRPEARRTLESATDVTVDLVPESLHTCIEDRGVPRDQVPLETEWRLTDLSTGIPEGLSFRNADGATVSLQSPVTTDTLRLEAVQCASARVSLTARHLLATGSDLVAGPEAAVQVEVQPPLEDFTNAALALTAVPGESPAVDVRFAAAPACQSGLLARMVLENPDGSTRDTADVSVPGSWPPDVAGACGPYTVRGRLVDPRSTPERLGNETASSLSVPPQLEALEGVELVARCGQGASAQVTQRIAQASCPGLDVSWTQVGDGPRLVEASLSGQSVTLATEESVPLEELVGQSVTVQVTAQAGAGNSSTREHVLPITAEPFVDVTHSLESPTGSEKSLVGVVVELRNTTGCEVGGLSYVERPEGLEPIAGTVKLDGEPLAEMAVEGGFQVDGVRLAAQATGRLTYVARPRLLTSPRFSGEVFLNQVPVSGVIPPPASSGCGCSGGGSGAAIFGLLALARLLRRRSPRD